MHLPRQTPIPLSAGALAQWVRGNFKHNRIYLSPRDLLLEVPDAPTGGYGPGHPRQPEGCRMLACRTGSWNTGDWGTTGAARGLQATHPLGGTPG